MPKSTFAASNVRSSGTTFPVLKLTNMGDYARIKLAEPHPTYEWVHALRKPKLSPVTGQLVMKNIEVGKGDNKETKSVPDMEFVGQPICLGSDDILSDRGVDEDHCPVCKAALEYPDFFERPERKWAVHVLKYSTKGNGTQPISPPQVEVKVWRLSDKRYARVVSVLEEFAAQVDGDVMRVDLTLGPVTNTMYQNYEIQGSPRCALADSPEDWKRAERIFEENHVEDLSPFCGRKADPRFIRSDIEEILSKWKAARSGGAPVEQPDFSGALDSSLLDAPGAAPKAAAPKAAPEPPTASLDALDDTVGAPAAADAPAKEAEAPAKKETVSFASLMDSIGQS